MNKGDLVSSIAENAGITKSQAQDALNATLSAISGALVGGDKVTLIGFGTFSSDHRPERKGRNPQTQKEMIIPAKNVVKFKPGKDLSNKVNA